MLDTGTRNRIWGRGIGHGIPGGGEAETSPKTQTMRLTTALPTEVRLGLWEEGSGVIAVMYDDLRFGLVVWGTSSNPEKMIVYF